MQVLNVGRVKVVLGWGDEGWGGVRGVERGGGIAVGAEINIGDMSASVSQFGLHIAYNIQRLDNCPFVSFSL